MSKYIQNEITIADMNECKHLANYVCCNEESSNLGVYWHNMCTECKDFEKEYRVVDKW